MVFVLICPGFLTYSLLNILFVPVSHNSKTFTPASDWCIINWHPEWLRWLKKKKICLQHRRPRFDPWVVAIPWSREWQPTLVFLPAQFHGQRSLVGCPRGWQSGRRDWGTNTFPFIVNSDFLTFYLTSFFWSRSPSRISRAFSWHVSLGSLGWDSFSDFPCFWWSWQVWGVLIRYIVGSHFVCLTCFSQIDFWGERS